MLDETPRRDPTTSRRTVLRVGGSATAATLLAAAPTAGSPAAAQEASPAASPSAREGLEGRYVAVRSRTLTTGSTPGRCWRRSAPPRGGAGDDRLHPGEVLATIGEGFVPLLRDIDGFIAYLGITEPASARAAFITVCADKAGTDESTARAGAWLTENGYDFFQGDPIVVEGPIGIAFGALPGEVRTLPGEELEADASPVTDASPTPAEEPAGDYVVIRSRKLKAGRSGEELLELVREGFVPLVAEIPGTVAYLAVFNDETRDPFGVGVYAGKAHADESTRVAAEWSTQGAADFVEGDPIVVEGVLGLAVGARG